MASFFRNKLFSGIGTSEELVVTTNSGTRSTVIGLSLTNMKDFVVFASVRLQNNSTGTVTVTNTSGATTLTAVTDIAASTISVGDYITGTNVAPGARVLSKVNNGVDNNTITMTLPSTGAITTATIYSSSYYVKDVQLPPNQSLRVINGGEKLIMSNNMAMYIQSSDADSLDLVTSYVDIV